MGEHKPATAVITEDQTLRERDDSYRNGIRELHDAHGRSLFRYALALTCSADDAEDVVQEVFVRVAKDWERFRSVRNVKAYLVSSTRNATYRILKSRWRRESLHEAVAVELTAGCSLDPEAASVQSIMLRDVFARLPADQRDVVILKVVCEMTFQEISDAIGVSLNTVAGRYRYGIEKLRRALEGSENGR
jgi:RNA polymerase sigma-70 factor, ECF subfamily